MTMYFRYYSKNETWSHPCTDLDQTEPTGVFQQISSQISSRSVNIWKNGRVA